MIAHHPQLTLGHHDIKLVVARDVIGIQVGLIKRDTIDGDPTFDIAADHAVASDADDSLDEVSAVGLDKPQ